MDVRSYVGRRTNLHGQHVLVKFWNLEFKFVRTAICVGLYKCLNLNEIEQSLTPLFCYRLRPLLGYSSIMSERIIIAGPTGGAPNRLEINEFVKNDKFFSLYVQALRESPFTAHHISHSLQYLSYVETMYDADQDKDELSYFRIAGIHGLPYEPWNGAGQKLVDSPGDTEQRRYGGYCTHGSTLFPTWHRPYMALLEVRTSDSLHHAQTRLTF